MLFICLILTTSFLTGCAQLEQMEQEAAQQQAQDRRQNAETNCTHSAAYATGMNNATRSQPMQTNYAANNSCNFINMPSKQQNMINDSYISGYQFGLKNKPKQENININVNHHKNHPEKNQPWRCINVYGQKSCGYHCKQSGNLGICAQRPDEECVAKFGVGAECGYGCVETPFQVSCGKSRHYSCMVGAWDKVVCGKNCHKNAYGQAKCEVYQ